MRPGLADATSSPRQTATAAATAAAASSASSAAGTPAAASATATAAAAPGYFHAVLGRCSTFFVEHIEGRQTDVRDFLFAERDFMTR
jgi:hypothetical protein